MKPKRKTESPSSPAPETVVSSLSEPAIYQAEDGAIALRPDFAHETVWATQAQIAKIFGISRPVTTRHISSIFAQKELDTKSNVQKMHIANSAKRVAFYSLDIVLAVGYRTSSARAIRFRRWSSDVLRRYLSDGYAANARRLADSASRIARLRRDIEAIAETGKATRTLGEARGLLDLVSRYSRTWSALEGYDRESPPDPPDAAPSSRLDTAALLADLANLRVALIARGEASDLFARERSPGAYAAAVLAAFQTFGGADLHPGAARKAAELLYLVAKDHPFVDGNKRAAAFTAARFCGLANLPMPDPVALAAIALFVAESDPSRKSRVVGVASSLFSAAPGS